MKQLLFLLLFPCLALAQYPNNGNQKITLGEQTSADGLVYRGVANIDTVTATSKITRVNKQDTSAFILLDTVTNLLWHYKTASNGWIQAGGGVSVTSFSAGTTGLTPSTATTGAVTLGGTLAVPNGGTNRTTMPAGYILHGDGTSVDTAVGLFWDRTNNRLGINNNVPSTTLYTIGGNGDQLTLDNKGERYTQLSFKNNASINKAYVYYDNTTSRFEFGGTANTSIALITDNTEKMRVNTDGEVWIGYTADQGAYILQINGTPQSVNALVTTSDERFKENITPLNKGLEIVNKLKPVTFNFISDTKNNFSVNEEVGFIAQDVDRALSTETFAKSIVNSADDSEPTSTMGLATQNLIPILVKAIQEQNALIKALEQRILILENK